LTAARRDPQLNPREGNTMNWSLIESGWMDHKASAKQQWDMLTDEQLADTLGKRAHLSDRLQQAYGISKEETDRQISDWQHRQSESLQAATAK